MTDQAGDRGDPRRGTRRAVDIPCEVIRTDSDEPLRCRATDLSHSGIWLETHTPLQPDEPLVITFRPPEWPSPFSITVFGRVARVAAARSSTEGSVPGAAVEFGDLSEAERDALDACIEGLPPPRAKQGLP